MSPEGAIAVIAIVVSLWNLWLWYQARLQAYAEKLGESESEVIRLAVAEYLDAHEGDE